MRGGHVQLVALDTRRGLFVHLSICLFSHFSIFPFVYLSIGSFVEISESRSF